MFGEIGKFLRNGCYEKPTAYDLDVKTLVYKNMSDNEDPSFKHKGNSGFDLRAWITETDVNAKIENTSNKYSIILKPMERRMIHTGLYFNLPEHTEIQVRPRSGCAIKQGLSVINTPGTIN